MKFLFLDIDGVLNSVEYSVGMRTNERKMRIDDADPVKVGLLRFICEMTGARIVISSSWRVGRDLMWFDGFFSAYGWPLPPIYDVTPRGKGGNKYVRGNEVEEWLSEHEREHGKVESYVIFDDDNDFYAYQPLVKTNGVYGLTLKEVIKAIDILGLVAEDSNLNHLESLRAHVDFRPEG